MMLKLTNNIFKMRRFKLSHANITGWVEAWYDLQGKLVRIDYANANNISTDVQRTYKNLIPVLVDNIQAAFEKTPVVITEADFEVLFEDFRREYPYKRNTHLAEAYWPKLSSSEQFRAFCAAIEYRKYCSRNSKWYKPQIAETWLKKKEYLNDWKSL